MKATLKPEEERIVTPGPKAVDDLLGLPDVADGFLYLDALQVKSHDRVIEEYSRIGISATSAQVVRAGNVLTKFSQRDAQDCCKEQGGFLPSLPLLLNMLYGIAYGGNPAAETFLEGFLQEGRYITNTAVFQDQIMHYPCWPSPGIFLHDETRRFHLHAPETYQMNLENIPANSDLEKYVMALTGVHPDALIALGERMGLEMEMGALILPQNTLSIANIAVIENSCLFLIQANIKKLEKGYVRMVKE